MRQAEAWGTLERAWREMDDPGAMLSTAAALVLDPADMLGVVTEVVERMLVETGINDQHPLTVPLLRALQDAQAGAGDRDKLNQMVEEACRALPEDGSEDEHWRFMALAAVGSAGTALLMRSCTCPVDHAEGFVMAMHSAFAAVCHARIRHGRMVGRLASWVPESAALRWSNGWTCNALRAAVPVEMLLAPRMAPIPTGVPGDRGRGQA